MLQCLGDCAPNSLLGFTQWGLPYPRPPGYSPPNWKFLVPPLVAHCCQRLCQRDTCQQCKCTNITQHVYWCWSLASICQSVYCHQASQYIIEPVQCARRRLQGSSAHVTCCKQLQWNTCKFILSPDFNTTPYIHNYHHICQYFIAQNSI